MEEIVKYPDRKLRQVSELVNIVDDDVRTFGSKMFSSLDAEDGIGLAAIQLGVPKRIMVVDVQRPNGLRARHCFINPRIIDISSERLKAWESCLSLPNIICLVDRPVRIRVEVTDVDGMTRVICVGSLISRAIQHEIDHMDGVLILDRASSIEARNK